MLVCNVMGPSRKHIKQPWKVLVLFLVCLFTVSLEIIGTAEKNVKPFGVICVLFSRNVAGWIRKRYKGILILLSLSPYHNQLALLDNLSLDEFCKSSCCGMDWYSRWSAKPGKSLLKQHQQRLLPNPSKEPRIFFWE